MIRCVFGVMLGPDSQCKNAAKYVSTFHGKPCINWMKADGMLWCEEHKPEEPQKYPHGLTTIAEAAKETPPTTENER